MRVLTATLVLFAFALSVHAQKPNPESGKYDNANPIPPADYRILVQMADCKTLRCLSEKRSRLPSASKISDIVFFSRQIEIHSNRDVAAGLLHAIPADEAEQRMLASFTDWQEGATGSVHDMDKLARIYEEWPKLVTKAVAIRPDLMVEYVKYLRLATFDIHTDFTGNAERACRRNPAAFKKAFESLGKEERSFVLKQVFKPATCTAIFRAEAE